MVVVRGSAWRAAICASRRGTPASRAAMMNAARNMWVHGAEPGSLAGGSHPAVCGAAVEALAVVAADDGAFVAFTHGEVDRACSPRHERDERWLVALGEDAQRAVSSLEAKILGVGAAGLRHAQAVQPEEHGQCGVGVIEALGSEQEGAEFAAVHVVALAWGHLGSADVLGGVRRDAPVDVREPVVPHTVDSCRSIVEAAKPLSSIQPR